MGRTRRVATPRGVARGGKRSEAFLSAARAALSPTHIEAAVNVERRRKARRENVESEKQMSFVFIIGGAHLLGAPGFQLVWVIDRSSSLAQVPTEYS